MSDESDEENEFHTLAVIKGKYGLHVFDQQKLFVHHVRLHATLPVEGFMELPVATRREITQIILVTAAELKQQVQQYTTFLARQQPARTSSSDQCELTIVVQQQLQASSS